MDKRETLLKKLLEQQRGLRRVLTVSAFLLFPVVYLFVYATGGTQHAYLHIVYVLIVLGAFLYGFKGGLIAAVVAGIILGPLMPLNTTTGEMQTIENWLFRMLFFALIGLSSGGLFDYVYAQFNKVMFQTTHHVESGLPNYNHYMKSNPEDKPKTNVVAMTLQINNYESLIILLGRHAYYKVLKDLFDLVKKSLPESAIVIQADSRRFWIELSKIDHHSMAQDFSKTLEEQTFFGENVPLYLDFSIGYSIGDEAKTTTDRFNEADIAALHAKNNALKYVVFHDAHKEDQLLLQRLGELPLAIKNDELFIVYQPVLDMKENVVQLEALIRWMHHGEVLSPDQFIPLAEETRLIDQITAWLLDKVIEDYRVFSKIQPSIKMAINISQRNLFDPHLIENMIDTIKKSNIQHQLEIEMTESTLMLNRSLTQSFLEAFKYIGVESILDDFGTGYSSLSCLRDLPVKKVKIDQDFTLSITESEDTKQLVKTIIDLAHYMNLDVIAEGVEETEIFEQMRDLGVDYVQGFLFSKPMTFEETTLFLKKRQ